MFYCAWCFKAELPMQFFPYTQNGSHNVMPLFNLTLHHTTIHNFSPPGQNLVPEPSYETKKAR